MEDAHTTVVKNSFRIDPHNSVLLTREFSAIRQLISKVPVVRVHFEHDFDRIDELQSSLFDYMKSYSSRGSNPCAQII